MIVRRFFCVFAAIFVLVVGCSVPVLAEGESSVSPVENRPIPDFPDEAAELANHIIIYDESVNKFFLLCSNFLPHPFVSSSDSSVLVELDWTYDRTERYDVLAYTLDAVNGSDWVLGLDGLYYRANNYLDSGSGSTYFYVFFGLFAYNTGPVDSTKGYVVYSDFAIQKGTYSFFSTPSPIARTRPYLPLHTDLWQTIAAGVEKVVIASIAIVGTLVLVLLLRRLGKKIATF